MINPRYRHIVWDWNGTLLNDVSLCFELTNQALREVGLRPITMDEYRLKLCHPIYEFYKKVGFDGPVEEFSLLSERFHDRYEERLSEALLYPDSERALRGLKEAGFSQSILSALPSKILAPMVEHFNLRRLFTEIVGAPDSSGFGKIEFGKEWLIRSGFSSSDILMIGDTDHDFEVAEALGIDCLLVAQGYQHEEVLKKTGASVLSSIADLIG